MVDFSTLDIILVILLAIGIIRGAFHGLSGELAGLFGLAAAAAAGWFFYEPLGVYLADRTELTDLQADTAALLGILVAALIVLWAVSSLLRRIMEFTFKGLLERLGGALLGGIRYAVLLAIVLLTVAQFSDGAAHRVVTEDSIVARRALDHVIPFYEDLLQRFPDLPTPVERDAADPYSDEEW